MSEIQFSNPFDLQTALLSNFYRFDDDAEKTTLARGATPTFALNQFRHSPAHWLALCGMTLAGFMVEHRFVQWILQWQGLTLGGGSTPPTINIMVTQLAPPLLRIIQERFQPGQVFQDADWAPVMVVIPAGEFWMGSDEGELDSQASERPRHHVVIERAFALAQTPVTRQQFARFVDATENADWTMDDWDRRSKTPMVNVSWHGAQAYTRWLSEQLGANYGLPTEAQWEYACRAGTTTAYATGDTISTTQANFSRQLHGKDSVLAGHPIGYVDVGSYPANPWGLQDMHGNIWEWVQDTWHDNYAHAPLTGDTAWEDCDKDYRVMRGGCWHNQAKHLRCAARDPEDSEMRYYNSFGFRVTRKLP